LIINENKDLGSNYKWE
jgi:gag-polypeptide of LTR copia-type